MVEEIRHNLSNESMHYGNKKVVGVLDNVPDKLPRATLVSRRDTKKNFEPVHCDVYSKVNTSQLSLKQEAGFPTILKIAIPVVGAASLLLFGKSIGKGLKNYIKNFLK